jgi:hypothetical protein
MLFQFQLEFEVDDKIFLGFERGHDSLFAWYCVGATKPKHRNWVEVSSMETTLCMFSDMDTVDGIDTKATKFTKKISHGKT